MLPRLVRVISAAITRLEAILHTGRHPAIQDLVNRTLLRATLPARSSQQYTVRLHTTTVAIVGMGQKSSGTNPLALNAVTGCACTASWHRVSERMGRSEEFGVKKRQGTYNAIY